MSQHNITGSEVFGPKPFVVMRGVRVGAFRKRRAAARGWLAFGAGAVVALVAGAAIAAAVIGPEMLAAAPL